MDGTVAKDPVKTAVDPDYTHVYRYIRAGNPVKRKERNPERWGAISDGAGR